MNSSSGKAKKIVEYALKTLGVLVGLSVIGVFVYRAQSAGHLIAALVMGAIGVAYTTVLFRKGTHSADVHTFKRPTPWIVFAIIGGLVWSLGYKPPEEHFHSEHSLKSWKDKPFTIHGISPGMTRGQVTYNLGEPTGSLWLYHISMENLDAKQTDILLSIVMGELKDKSSVKTFGTLKDFRTCREALRSLFPDGKPAPLHLGMFRDTPAQTEAFRKTVLNSSTLSIMWPDDYDAPGLADALKKMEESKFETFTLIFFLAPEKDRDIQSDVGYASIWTLKRYPHFTFKQPGVALDYTPGTDVVDSVHGDELAFQSRVFAKKGEEIGPLPPDWPPLKVVESRQFSTDPAQLDKIGAIANVTASNQLIQLHFVDGKVSRASIFSTHYNE